MSQTTDPNARYNTHPSLVPTSAISEDSELPHFTSRAKSRKGWSTTDFKRAKRDGTSVRQPDTKEGCQRWKITYDPGDGRGTLTYVYQLGESVDSEGGREEVMVQVKKSGVTVFGEGLGGTTRLENLELLGGLDGGGAGGGARGAGREGRNFEARGFVFHCSGATQEECVNRCVFGSAFEYAQLRAGDCCYLYNLGTKHLFGPVRCTGKGVRIDPNANWVNKYPHQAQVEPIPNVTASNSPSSPEGVYGIHVNEIRKFVADYAAHQKLPQLSGLVKKDDKVLKAPNAMPRELAVAVYKMFELSEKKKRDRAHHGARGIGGKGPARSPAPAGPRPPPPPPAQSLKPVLHVQTPSGATITLPFKKTDTLEIVKNKVQSRDGCPPDLQALRFNVGGRQLEGGRTLEHYGVEKEVRHFSNLSFHLIYSASISSETFFSSSSSPSSLPFSSISFSFFWLFLVTLLVSNLFFSPLLVSFLLFSPSLSPHSSLSLFLSFFFQSTLYLKPRISAVPDSGQQGQFKSAEAKTDLCRDLRFAVGDSVRSRCDPNSSAMLPAVVVKMWHNFKGNKYPYLVEIDGLAIDGVSRYRVPLDTNAYIMTSESMTSESASTTTTTTASGSSSLVSSLVVDDGAPLFDPDAFAELQTAAAAKLAAAERAARPRCSTDKERERRLLFDITPEMDARHNELSKYKDKIAQHIILVIDASKSMTKKDSTYTDVNKSPIYNPGENMKRIDSVRLNLCKYMKDKLEHTTDLSDHAVCTLILMEGGTATVSFKLEPFSHVTYNRMVRTCKVTVGGEGCYVPALELVANLINEEALAGIRSVAVFFQSDGRPSDRGDGLKGVERSIKAAATRIGESIGKGLTAHLSGVGDYDNFHMLRTIEAELGAFDCVSLFDSSNRDSSSMSESVSKFSIAAEQSLHEMNQDREGDVKGGKVRKKSRAIARERSGDKNFLNDVWTMGYDEQLWECFSAVHHKIERLDYDAENQSFDRRERALVHPRANGFCVRSRTFGEGSERFTFLLSEAILEAKLYKQTLVGSNKVAYACVKRVGDEFIAKTGRYRHDDDTLDFHRTFVRQHFEASAFAMEFNRKLDAAVAAVVVPAAPIRAVEVAPTSTIIPEKEELAPPAAAPALAAPALEEKEEKSGPPRYSGTIMTFEKGFGVIQYRANNQDTDADMAEVFFHFKELVVPEEVEATLATTFAKNKWRTSQLIKGEAVEFEIGLYSGTDEAAAKNIWISSIAKAVDAKAHVAPPSIIAPSAPPPPGANDAAVVAAAAVATAAAAAAVAAAATAAAAAATAAAAAATASLTDFPRLRYLLPFLMQYRVDSNKIKYYLVERFMRPFQGETFTKYNNNGGYVRGSQHNKSSPDAGGDGGEQGGDAEAEEDADEEKLEEETRVWEEQKIRDALRRSLDGDLFDVWQQREAEGTSLDKESVLMLAAKFTLLLRTGAHGGHGKSHIMTLLQEQNNEATLIDRLTFNRLFTDLGLANKRLPSMMEALTEEGDEDEEEDSSEEEEEKEKREDGKDEIERAKAEKKLEMEKEQQANMQKEIDVAQAFTHFTHVFSNDVTMVCDIQGVRERDKDGSNWLTLTDPAIHTAEDTESRTNKKDSGFEAFYVSHVCNAVCRLLGLESSLSLRAKRVRILGCQNTGFELKAAKNQLKHFAVKSVITTDEKNIDVIVYREPVTKATEKVLKVARVKGTRLITLGQLTLLVAEQRGTKDKSKKEQQQQAADSANIITEKKEKEETKKKKARKRKNVKINTLLQHLKDALLFDLFDSKKADLVKTKLIESLLLSNEGVMTLGEAVDQPFSTIWRAAMNPWRKLGFWKSELAPFAPGDGWQGESREFSVLRRSMFEGKGAAAREVTIESLYLKLKELAEGGADTETDESRLAALKVAIIKSAASTKKKYRYSGNALLVQLEKAEDEKREKAIAESQRMVLEKLQVNFEVQDVMQALDEQLEISKVEQQRDELDLMDERGVDPAKDEVCFNGEMLEEILNTDYKTRVEKTKIGGQIQLGPGETKDLPKEWSVYTKSLQSLGFDLKPAEVVRPAKMKHIFDEYKEGMDQYQVDLEEAEKAGNKDDRSAAKTAASKVAKKAESKALEDLAVFFTEIVATSAGQRTKEGEKENDAHAAALRALKKLAVEAGEKETKREYDQSEAWKEIEVKKQEEKVKAEKKELNRWSKVEKEGGEKKKRKKKGKR